VSLEPDVWRFNRIVYGGLHSRETYSTRNPHEIKEEEKFSIEGGEIQPLFTPEKIKKLVQRTHGKLVNELEDMSEEEDTGMCTLAQELIDEIEDLDDETTAEGDRE